MMEIMFILGRDEELSFLELVSYFKAREINFNIMKREKEIVFVSLPNLDFDKVINELGGTVKIGKVFDNIEEFEFFDKAKIGISIYKKGGDLEEQIKSIFKKQNLRYVLKRPKENAFTPTEIIKQDLVDNGFEFLVSGNKTARTIAVYNPFLYKQRDEQRPFIDERKISSIRLAKILINLSMTPKGTLMDPFCGYGTILQEAMLLGLDVKGLEVDNGTVEKCIKNLKWIKKQHDLKSDFGVLQGDSRKLSYLFKSADAIVTEPYLGPFLKKKPSKEEAEKIVKDLEKIYSGFFKEARKVLKGKMVIVFPRFLIENKEIKISQDVFKKAGFNIFSVSEEIRIPIKYDVEGGKLQREIYVLN